MSVNRMQVTSNFDSDRQYKLLQLTPTLLEALRKDELELRSNGDSVFVCTQKTTHLLRRLKQSNTLMLTHANENELQAFSAPTELLETIETPGEVNWSQFPIYGGKNAVPPPINIELTLSSSEYKSMSRDKPVVELNGGSYVVSPDVVHDILVDLVSGMVEKGDLELVSDLMEVQLQTEEPEAVVRAVYNMFTSEESPKGLDKTKITQWVGSYILRQHPEGMQVPALTREWKQDLPIRMDTRLENLVEAVETKPGTVKYLDKSKLSPEPRTRFSELFRLKQAWLLSEIGPFVLDLVPPTQKLENWILKYARKTRKNNDFIISGRKL